METNEQTTTQTQTITRRDFLNLSWKFGAGLVLGKVATSLSGCAPSPGNVSETHPTPVGTRSELPSSAVVLYDQPDQRVSSGALELYQNTSPGWANMPFIVYVDTEAFRNFATLLQEEGVTGNDMTRLVVHWPGDPAGAELMCSENGSLVRLEFARAIYEHVYVPNFQGQDLSDPTTQERFLSMVESQMNYVLYHEAEHIGHCRNGVESSQAEPLARAAEARRTEQVGKVIYIQLKEGFDLNQAITYVEGFRN